jgi:hypothetical protein
MILKVTLCWRWLKVFGKSTVQLPEDMFQNWRLTTVGKGIFCNKSIHLTVTDICEYNLSLKYIVRVQLYEFSARNANTNPYLVDIGIILSLLKQGCSYQNLRGKHIIVPGTTVFKLLNQMQTTLTQELLCAFYPYGEYVIKCSRTWFKVLIIVYILVQKYIDV